MVTGRQAYNRGIALLATLLAVALMTLLVVDFTTSAALGYRSAANQADQLRAYYLARSGIEVGLAVLTQRALTQALEKQHYDSLDQAWARPLPPIPLDGGTVSLSIVDEARKFNVNSIFNARTLSVNGQAAAILLRLLSNLGVSPALLPVLIDWLDPDSIESPGGAEADYYLRLVPPYEPRNGPMPTIGDLRMLKGMDDATFMRLRQFLTTMPESRVNANTASAQLLAALAPQLENNPDLVKQIVTVRAARPFAQVTDLLNLAGISEFEQSLNPLLTVQSDYFTISAEGAFAGARKRIDATFRANPNGNAELMNWHED